MHTKMFEFQHKKRRTITDLVHYNLALKGRVLYKPNTFYCDQSLNLNVSVANYNLFAEDLERRTARTQTMSSNPSSTQ